MQSSATARAASFSFNFLPPPPFPFGSLTLTNLESLIFKLSNDADQDTELYFSRESERERKKVKESAGAAEQPYEWSRARIQPPLRLLLSSLYPRSVWCNPYYKRVNASQLIILAQTFDYKVCLRDMYNSLPNKNYDK